MSSQIIIEGLNEKVKEIEKYVHSTFPRKASKVAVDHFKDNFRKGGFVNDGLKKWQPAKRIGKKGKAATRYGTLLSSRNNLFESIRGEAGDGKVVIRSDVEYAEIHNSGGEITHPISRKQRVKAYETHVKKTGTAHRDKNSMWKGLALTKKTDYKIRIPQRQFIGNSVELENQLKEMAEKDINNILNK